MANQITDNRTLVHAAAELAQEIPDLQVRLIGRGSDRLIRELNDYAHSRNLTGLLDFHGFAHREQLPELLSACHAFAAPSTYLAVTVDVPSRGGIDQASGPPSPGSSTG